jgi:hypothetical protein
MVAVNVEELVDAEAAVTVAAPPAPPDPLVEMPPPVPPFALTVADTVCAPLSAIEPVAAPPAAAFVVPTPPAPP